MRFTVIVPYIHTPCLDLVCLFLCFYPLIPSPGPGHDGNTSSTSRLTFFSVAAYKKEHVKFLFFVMVSFHLSLLPPILLQMTQFPFYR